MNQFHFGSIVLPNPDSNFSSLSSDFANDNFMGNRKKDVATLRDLDCSAISRLQSEKLDSYDLTQAVVGFNQHGNGPNGRSLVQAVGEQMKLNKFLTSTFEAEQSINLPLEFKCLLCNNFFKEAVLIPCCQHSFCEICIRKVPIEKKRCPKCYSSKCDVKDLLPNLSLRQATEHFLESQMLDAGLENGMQTYVPDGESHIQAKDVSSALALQPQQVKQRDEWEDSYRRHSIQIETQEFIPPPDFQGENQPVIPLANHDEAHSHTSRNRLYNSGGGDRNFVGGGLRKGVRTCYTCGAPDHLMRDCPVANPNPMFQPGNGMFHGRIPPYAPPYWNGPSFPPFRPYPTIYGNPAMIAFNASTAAPLPFAVPPPYLGPMHGGLPLSAGMRMGNMGPPPPPDHFGLQLCESKHSDEDTGREPLPTEVSNENSEIVDKQDHMELTQNEALANCLDGKGRLHFGELDAIYKRLGISESIENPVNALLPNYGSEASMGEEAFSPSLEENVRKKRKKKKKQSSYSRMISPMAEFFGHLVKQMVDHQENHHNKFTKMIERLDDERRAREEAWRNQELAHFEQEIEARAKDKANAENREAMIVSYLEKITGHKLELSSHENHVEDKQK